MKPVAIIDNPHLGTLCIFEKTKEIGRFLVKNNLNWVASTNLESFPAYRNFDNRIGMPLRNGYRFIAIPMDPKKILNDIIND